VYGTLNSSKSTSAYLNSHAEISQLKRLLTWLQLLIPLYWLQKWDKLLLIVTIVLRHSNWINQRRLLNGLLSFGNLTILNVYRFRHFIPLILTGLYYERLRQIYMLSWQYIAIIIGLIFFFLRLVLHYLHNFMVIFYDWLIYIFLCLLLWLWSSVIIHLSRGMPFLTANSTSMWRRSFSTLSSRYQWVVLSVSLYQNHSFLIWVGLNCIWLLCCSHKWTLRVSEWTCCSIIILLWYQRCLSNIFSRSWKDLKVCLSIQELFEFDCLYKWRLLIRSSCRCSFV
jgi:hypothetical protein